MICGIKGKISYLLHDKLKGFKSAGRFGTSLIFPKGTTLVRYKKGFVNITSIMLYVLFFNIGVNLK